MECPSSEICGTCTHDSDVSSNISLPGIRQLHVLNYTGSQHNQFDLTTKRHYTVLIVDSVGACNHGNHNQYKRSLHVECTGDYYRLFPAGDQTETSHLSINPDRDDQINLIDRVTTETWEESH